MKGSDWETLCQPQYIPQACLLNPQMYVHHDIYDLIFKYVGTMEASEVGSLLPVFILRDESLNLRNSKCWGWRDSSILLLQKT